MNEIDIQQLIDTNHRLLLLLGYATCIVMDYEKLEAYHDNSDKCKWFYDSVDNVVYKNKPLPPLPKE